MSWEGAISTLLSYLRLTAALAKKSLLWDQLHPWSVRERKEIFNCSFLLHLPSLELCLLGSGCPNLPFHLLLPSLLPQEHTHGHLFPLADAKLHFPDAFPISLSQPPVKTHQQISVSGLIKTDVSWNYHQNQNNEFYYKHNQVMQMSLSGSWQAAKVIPEFIKFCCCCNVKVVVPREGAASCPSLVPEQVTGVLFCPSTSVYLFPGLVMSVLNPQPPTEGFSGIIGGFISGGCAESTHTPSSHWLWSMGLVVVQSLCWTLQWMWYLSWNRKTFSSVSEARGHSHGFFPLLLWNAVSTAVTWALRHFSSRRKLESDLFELPWVSRAFSSQILTLKKNPQSNKPPSCSLQEAAKSLL